MKRITSKENLKMVARSWQLSQKTIGFVPTMGALHAGHLSLVRQSKAENDLTVVSIFINPLQFNNASDLEKYPRTMEMDLAMLESEGVDFVFTPSESDFYSDGTTINLDFGIVSDGLEGEHRPGHFSGVGIVVARLFHLVNPTRAYFGSKDLQQVAVIKALVRDLAFNITIVRCPTFREASGLAMSSRNQRLSANGMKVASLISASLKTGVDKSYYHTLGEAKNSALLLLAAEPEIELEYLEWVNADTMQIVDKKADGSETALCIAAWVEGVRLIDNLIIPA